MPTPSEAGQTSSQVSRSIQTRNRVRMVRQRRGVQQDDVDTLYDASSQSNATAPRRVAAWVQTLPQSAFPAGATQFGNVTELRGASPSPRMSLRSDLRIDLDTLSGSVNIRWNGGSLLATGNVHIRSSPNVWSSNAAWTPDGGSVAESFSHPLWPPHHESPVNPGWPLHHGGTSHFIAPYHVGGMFNHQFAVASSMTPAWSPWFSLMVTHYFRHAIRGVYPFTFSTAYLNDRPNVISVLNAIKAYLRGFETDLVVLADIDFCDEVMVFWNALLLHPRNPHFGRTVITEENMEATLMSLNRDRYSVAAIVNTGEGSARFYGAGWTSWG